MPHITIKGVAFKEALAAWQLAQAAQESANNATNTVISITSNVASQIAANAANVFVSQIGPTLNTTIQLQIASANLDGGLY